MKIRVTIDIQRDGDRLLHRLQFGSSQVEPTEAGLKSFLLNEVDDCVVDLVDILERRATRWVEESDDSTTDIFSMVDPDDDWNRMFEKEPAS